jgi:NodT family efflux transporter outer membrane factor (OMF) lipoprotein
MIKYILRTGMTAGLTMMLCGCADLVRTPYQPPAMTMPPAWSLPSPAKVSYDGRWWQRFGDPTLNHLMEEALRRNTNLAIAALRLRKALLQAELADSQRLPGVQIEGSASYSRDLRTQTRENKTFGASIFANYTVDLWGELASDYDAARWEAQATEDDRANTALALTGTTASLYWQVGYLNQRIALSQASIDYTRRSLELAQLRHRAGAATTLDILEAERSLATQEANQAALLQQRTEARNELTIIFDQPPQQALGTAEPNSLMQIDPPEVAAGLPAQLLARRPDLRAAEARLRSTLATGDATRASFYPALSLSGSLGRSSAELSRFLSNPIGTIAADLALPFVQWRDMQRTIKISEADYEQATLAFRQTLYTALVEVENGLSARQRYQEEYVQLAKALEAARKAEELYNIQYQAGGIAVKPWLDAQESRRQAEVSVAENRFNQLQNHVALIKALGGDVGENGNSAASARQQER